MKEIFVIKKNINFVKSAVLPLLTWRNKLIVVGASGSLLVAYNFVR